MEKFKKILYAILFTTFITMIGSSFFFNITFFQWLFGISFLAMAIDSVVVSSVELSEDNIPNPFTRDDIYLDWHPLSITCCLKEKRRFFSPFFFIIFQLKLSYNHSQLLIRRVSYTLEHYWLHIPVSSTHN